MESFSAQAPEIFCGLFFNCRVVSIGWIHLVVLFKVLQLE
ncbi:hypothetical protein FM106_03905 [Brachybacterium faecium]|nr:hypothetical protein FM106_03905 [Brachybacterium faecium]